MLSLFLIFINTKKYVNNKEDCFIASDIKIEIQYMSLSPSNIFLNYHVYSVC